MPGFDDIGVNAIGIEDESPFTAPVSATATFEWSPSAQADFAWGDTIDTSSFGWE